MADERNPVPPPGDGPQQPESDIDQTSTFDPFVDEDDQSATGAAGSVSAADTDPDATSIASPGPAGPGGGDSDATRVGAGDPDATRVGAGDPDATRIGTAAAGAAGAADAATRKVTPQPWAARAAIHRAGGDDADLNYPPPAAYPTASGPAPDPEDGRQRLSPPVIWAIVVVLLAML